MSVTMTWPDYLAGACTIDGRDTRLGRGTADVLATLLLQHPERGLTVPELVERIWPYAEGEPEWSEKVIRERVRHLRGLGVPIAGEYGRGYRIPAIARGAAGEAFAAAA